MSLADTIKGVVGMDPTEHADADMKDVLNAFKSLNAKPIEDCTADEARQQPTVTNAVKKLMQENVASRRQQPFSKYRHRTSRSRAQPATIPRASTSLRARVRSL